MIQYLKHSRIDKERWDGCISRSVNRRVYAFSWYLDLVSPHWDALVEDDYTSVFPLTCYHKWSVSYLAQPWFTQQLGLFSTSNISESQVAGFIRAIPRSFSFIEIHLNAMNRYPGGEGVANLRSNYEMNLAPAYGELNRNYSQNTRRNIRKALDSEISISRGTGAEELIDLFRRNFGEKEGKLRDRHYDVLRRLIMCCIDHDQGYILGSKTKEGSLAAGAFFLFDRAHIYFLFAASSPEARQNGAMFLLIDRFIAEHAGKELILDFEGGHDKDLGRFYKSFGAVDVPYPVLQINRLSKPAEKALYFLRKLRK